MSIIDVVKFVTNQKERSEFVAQYLRIWKPWAPSDKVIKFIAEWESGVLNGKNFQGHQVTDGMILKVYNDSKGIPTVGCGHRVWVEDKLKVGDIITLDKAKEFFVKDQQKMIDAIHRKVKIPLLQKEYDAIFSVTFNAGEGGSLNNLAKELNKGKYDKMPEFIKTFKAASTPLRRVREADIWEKGVYDASH